MTRSALSGRVFAVSAMLVCVLGAAGEVAADDSFSTLGGGLRDREKTEIEVHGYFRTRLSGLRNLDLDRGLTPSGAPLFPVPSGDPNGQWLTNADMRLRTDVSIFAPRGGVVVRGRFDFLDNLAMGSLASGNPATSTTQLDPAGPIAVRRLYAEVALPFGVLAAGRMANTWGVGMVANGGDGIDMDSADSTDRIVFATPVLEHVWALAYDWSSTGPTVARSGRPDLDASPVDDVHSLTFAVVRGLSDVALARRDRAGLWSMDYGLVYAHRRQDKDSTSWLGGSGEGKQRPITMPRDFQAHLVDVWARLHGAWLDVQLEVAASQAVIGQPSIVPGVRYTNDLQSEQLGAVLKVRLGRQFGVFARLTTVWASGDPTPGMGYRQSLTRAAPKPGGLDGSQASMPLDNRIDNFRAHSDFRIDRILFREIIGGITDATTLALTLGHRSQPLGAGTLQLECAGIVSAANQSTSTPSGQQLLGIELDPTITWLSRDGFRLQVQYAALFPLGGLDNKLTGQTAQPAQLWRLHLGFLF